MPSSNKQDNFVALVHLNDVGVFLLQQRRYRQAYATFHEAMQLVPDTWLHHHDRNPARHHKPSAEVPVDTDSLLERAKDRMLFEEVFPSSELTKTYTLTVEDLDKPKDLETVRDLVLQHIGGSVIFRIGQLKSSSTGKPSSANNYLCAAIAIYNFGVSRLVYANALPHHQRPDIHARHLKQSRHCIRRSDSLLKRLGNEVCFKEGDDIVYTILCVRTVVLVGLQEHVAGTTSKNAEKIKQKMLRVSSEIGSLKMAAKKNCRSALAA